MHRLRGHHVSAQGEDGHLQSKDRGNKESKPASALILAVWPPELCENIFLLLKPPSVWQFVMAAQVTNMTITGVGR